MLKRSLLISCILLSTFFLSENLFGKTNQADEQIRSGYGGRMNEAFLDKLKANGFNAYMWGPTHPSMVSGGKLEWKNNQLTVQYDEEIVNRIAQAADWAYQRGMKLFVTLDFNEYTMAALQKLGEYNMGVVEGPRSYNAKGIHSAPAPGERKYWNGILQAEAVCIARIAREHPGIAGILIDVEMYGGGGLQMWRYSTSFDDSNFDAFRKKYSSQHAIPALKVGQRFNWLKENGLLSIYYDFLTNIVFDSASELAKAVYDENPEMTLGMYPFSINWFYNGYIKGLAEGTKKDVWIFPEKEYELGYTPDVDATISQLKKMGLSFRYVSGLWIGKHEPFALAWNAGRAAEKADGYWLFTTCSLDGDPTRHDPDGPYALAKGATQEQYWQALKSVNQLIATGKNLSPSSQKLITPNPWADGTPEQSKVSYEYSIQPDAPTAEDEHHNALFDGLMSGHVVETTAAWSLSPEHINKNFSVVIDLAKEYILGRIAMTVPLGDGLSNLKIVDKVAVNIQYRAAGQWKNLAQIGSDKFHKEVRYFNVNISLDKPVKTNMVLITLQPKITKDQMQILIKRWDGLFLGLSEVAIWSK